MFQMRMALRNEALEVSFEYQAFDLKWLGHSRGFGRRAEGPSACIC